MDQGALSALRAPFELLADSPFDLQAVCIVAATEDLRARRALVQKRSRAGSERFSTSDGRFVEIILCGIPGDGMRFAPLAKAAEQCVGRDEPWLWTVFSGVHNTADKLGRIQRLQPLVSSGTLRFSRRQVTLLDQLRQFPMGAHDDGPDALEMAVSAAGGWHPMTCSTSRIRTPQVSIYDDPRLAAGARELYFGRQP